MPFVQKVALTLNVLTFSEGNEECLWRPVLPVKIDDDYTATSLFSVPEQKSFELSCTRE